MKPLVERLFSEQYIILRNRINHKSFADIILFILSVVITLFLLMRYDWISEFSINRAGHLMPNWFAIFGMVFGFVILPLILFWLTRRERAENDERVK